MWVYQTHTCILRLDFEPIPSAQLAYGLSRSSGLSWETKVVNIKIGSANKVQSTPRSLELLTQCNKITFYPLYIKSLCITWWLHNVYVYSTKLFLMPKERQYSILFLIYLKKNRVSLTSDHQSGPVRKLFWVISVNDILLIWMSEAAYYN